jgi:hypothetical protein
VTDRYDHHPPEHEVVRPSEPDEHADEDNTPLEWEGRVFAVALVWALPGVLFGLLMALFAPIPMSGSAVAGGLIAALAGGLMEADHWG